MEAQTELECRELLALDNKFLALTNAVRVYKDNPKAVKCCAKIVGIERKNFKNCRAPIPVADLNNVKWRYDDLADIVKRLQKTKDAQIYGKASSDFDNLVSKVEEEVKLINKKLSISNGAEAATKAENAVRDFACQVADGAKNIGGKVADGAKNFGEKVSSTVNDAVGKLKKLIDGKDSE